MSAKTISITIPHPCSQNWDKMEVQDGKRFCVSCQKLVIDFTNYRNDEIIKTLLESKVCGRFSQNQINQLSYYLIPNPTPRYWMKYIGVLAIGTSIFFQGCDAQPYLKTDSAQDINEKKVDGRPEMVSAISGYLVDENNNPMVNNRIEIENTSYFALTNQYGRYEIALPANYNVKNNQLLVIDQMQERLTINFYQERQDTIRTTLPIYTMVGEPLLIINKK
jgi:uncharacterized ubiquitin-like protein YukD